MRNKPRENNQKKREIFLKKCIENNLLNILFTISFVLQDFQIWSRGKFFFSQKTDSNDKIFHKSESTIGNNLLNVFLMFSMEAQWSKLINGRLPRCYDITSGIYFVIIHNKSIKMTLLALRRTTLFFSLTSMRTTSHPSFWPYEPLHHSFC